MVKVHDEDVTLFLRGVWSRALEKLIGLATWVVVLVEGTSWVLPVLPRLVILISMAWASWYF